MNCLSHPILKPIASYFSVYSDDAEMIDKLSLPTNTHYENYVGNVDWDKMQRIHTLHWHDLTEEAVAQRLQKTVLHDYDNVLIQLHYGYEDSCNNVIFNVPVTLFTEHWESILIASSAGFLLATPDKQYVMEILSKPEIAYANFKI